MKRRDLLARAGLAAAALSFSPSAQSQGVAPRKGRIRQCACPGVFGKTTFEEKCRLAKRLGLYGIDLVRPGPDWDTLKSYGLICSMVPSHSLTRGLNAKANHEECLAAIRQSIEAAAAAGFPNVICFSGNRNGISDEEGWENCTVALKQVVGLAEQKGITLCMELLNSKRNHKDYQCDRTAWGVELCKRVGSPNFKLLYDIYHMQIMEGDIIATIREALPYIAHIHTAGVPGRHEIDETQELYYPAIMRAIAEAGFKGFVAHEYTPTGDPTAALEKAVHICDV
ncbi:MAG: TIM barrel protein [Kiritimatiellae bacterium]|nr:TIM barrel protein [Kiritimatiellia bacterium]